MVADAVGGLRAQVEPGEDHVGAPHRVVEALGYVGAQGVLAGVARRPVAAVVAERDRLRQRDVEPRARAIDVATWATSSAWVRRVR